MRPSPKANCRAVFPPPDKAAAPTYAETEDKDHGRREWRRLWVAPTDPFVTGFAGAAQLVRIERHIWNPSAAPQPTITVVFGVTSRLPSEASPAQLLAAVRAHWATIENGQHHRRDRTFREDASPVRDPQATPSFAALRCAAIFLFGQTKRAQRRPQDYHLPDFQRWALHHKATVIRWFTHAYHPP